MTTTEGTCVLVTEAGSRILPLEIDTDPDMTDGVHHLVGASVSTLWHVWVNTENLLRARTARLEGPPPPGSDDEHPGRRLLAWINPPKWWEPDLKTKAVVLDGAEVLRIDLARLDGFTDDDHLLIPRRYL